ncbi:TlpA disulfide reductase family protein [Mesobacillus harenae]|uniref:TlpA disulfide reductase family protein n=1 Tax=Mesobacillus harenae TaxID=2213203 RepID=UPI00158077D7|nr:TlpA disulfide reductase family protein [Mesobacillus harenae]
MKKFLVIAAFILAALFIVDTFVLKQKGLINQIEQADKYEKLENPDQLPYGIEAENLAPEFTLTDLNGNTVSLQDYQGKKVLLNFWASWCPPCKAEMPYMQKLYEQYQDDGFEILAVNITTTEKKPGDASEFVEANQLTFPIPMDEKGTVSAEYEIMAYPTSFFIDSDGVIRSKVIGGMTEEYIEKEIAKLP